MSPQEASGTVGVLLPRDIPQADLIAFAQEADDYGFGELWVVEDLGYRGGLVQAATVLARTRRIRVGVGLLPAAARNVAFAAMEVATLAQLHPGRLDIAVGHGMPDWMRSAGSWPASPLTLLGEYIRTLKTLLAGQSADTDGRYVRLDGVRLDPSVLPEHVPDVFAGVRGPKSLALSGEVADGTLLAEPASPEYVRQALSSINPQCPHRIAAYNITVVDDDPHAALAAARPAVQPLGDPDWAPHLIPLGFHDELAALRRTSKSAQEFSQAIPEEWVRRLALTGTPDQVRARVQDLFEAGVTTAVLSPVGPDYRSALAGLAKVL
ncbi:LLM class flavin-dependent oxidoreductase [Streptomyces europaeiscabiei]|uniref:LLM class flavin-dependent oxidoreductase n=1 Tax=Streptomyces europaeiscabiei TaxID=146819 RepID=UPI00062865E8|nr:LLM class flavin-dependent oxidoreductase [Streptomyces europaeiscabiei]MDX2528409.1 LLM class flavin-dependent oxidoreductase [Streptomyces europaeiscabiei]MDX2761132.1 LLM class flavin-dependent oxidoreductase [Streptomyces europaeiscabiei]MDX2768371.1 LLM class flavin-dependent oxidoreductase [Streptomyces europaeiscabiei]MDX3777489.1 LLM class flavin-dependent oxidoreductase [Streptomyces europaeiscabiei]MDX3862772.1 LLM class flavin-dependent oxidoreductase [Streptomyces europaeiscabie